MPERLRLRLVKMLVRMKEVGIYSIRIYHECERRI